MCATLFGLHPRAPRTPFWALFPRPLCASSDKDGIHTWNALCEQSVFVQQITAAGRQAVENKRDRIATKIEKLNRLLSSEGQFAELVNLRTPVFLPLHPRLPVRAPQG